MVNPETIECIRNSIISFQRGRLTQADLIVRITRSPIPAEWKKVLVNTPTIAAFDSLLGVQRGIELNVPWLGRIKIDPPAIFVTKTKAQAGIVLRLNPFTSPWNNRNPVGDLVIASVAKTLAAVADRRIKTKIILSTEGALETALWAMATADGLSVMTIGFTLLPPGYEGSAIDIQILSSGRVLSATLNPFRVGKAIRHWINRGGNFAALASLTGIKETHIPFDEEGWYLFGASSEEELDMRRAGDILLPLMAAGLDPRPAREIAKFHLGEKDELRKLKGIADTIAYYYHDRASQIASIVARILQLNLTVLQTYLEVR